MDAKDFLKEALETMEKRGQQYDGEKERSMEACVRAFNAITGENLSVHSGWLFMAVLKLVRAHSAANLGTKHTDSYVDLAAYASLAGECASERAEAFEALANAHAAWPEDELGFCPTTPRF